MNLIFVALSSLGIRPSIGTFAVWRDPATGELVGSGDWLFFAWLPALDLATGLMAFVGMRELLTRRISR